MTDYPASLHSYLAIYLSITVLTRMENNLIQCKDLNLYAVTMRAKVYVFNHLFL